MILFCVLFGTFLAWGLWEASDICLRVRKGSGWKFLYFKSASIIHSERLAREARYESQYHEKPPMWWVDDPLAPMTLKPYDYEKLKVWYKEIKPRIEANGGIVAGPFRVHEDDIPNAIERWVE